MWLMLKSKGNDSVKTHGRNNIDLRKVWVVTLSVVGEVLRGLLGEWLAKSGVMVTKEGAVGRN